MVTAAGEVKIGDLGLARLFWKPLQSLYTGDKVVVTIWYRAPELLLGSKHYTAAIDLWAVGCIFAELLALRPIFKGEEAKMEKKSTVPFQKNQMQKIIEILGTPTSKSTSLATLHPVTELSGHHCRRQMAWCGPTAGVQPTSILQAISKSPRILVSPNRRHERVGIPTAVGAFRLRSHATADRAVSTGTPIFYRGC